MATPDIQTITKWRNYWKFRKDNFDRQGLHGNIPSPNDPRFKVTASEFDGSGMFDRSYLDALFGGFATNPFKAAPKP